MNRKDVSRFEAVQAQLQSAYKEIGALSGKKPDDAVNKFKLKVINQILLEANKILKDDIPIRDFAQFDEEDLPTNSDTLFVLSQYLHNLEKLRADNIAVDYDDKSWHWIIDGAESQHRTAPPGKLKY